jgi:Nucleosome binding factor SPN, SPT16 subunit
MATSTAAKSADKAKKSKEDSSDQPMIDNVGQAVKKMIEQGKKKGYITYDELNAALPADQYSSEQIEDTMSSLNEMGINVVENEEQEEPEAANSNSDGDDSDAKRDSGNLKDDDVGRTDDPVRMYLREMGSVELLSREGEIAIAKRIEAGREMMISGIYQSPLTLMAIVRWYEELLEERILLREIVDLEVTYGGVPDPDDDGDAAIHLQNAAKAKGEGEDDDADDVNDEDEPDSESDDDDDADEDETLEADAPDNDDEEDEESQMSLAVLEETLRPQVMGGL